MIADAGGRSEWLVVVSGERWTDAVVSAPLAGRLDTAVLMSPPSELRADAAEFIERAGVERVLVVGPSSGGGDLGEGRGVSAGVVSALRALGVSVERVAGDSVYGTAAAVARRVGDPGVLGDYGRTAVLASGVVFADALVAGPFASRGRHPVLLTPPDALNPDAARFLAAGTVDSAVVMGGTAAVSQRVRDEVAALGVEVVPVSGTTRFDTAVKAANLVLGKYNDVAGRPCFSSAAVGVARARVPFDSFSAAPLLARLCAPLLLSDPDVLPPETVGFIDAAREEHGSVRLQIFGGDAAVSQAAIDAYLHPDGAQEAVSAGLSPGACGGTASDAPSRLVDDARSAGLSWSPDCSKIAYSVNGRLWVADLDGANAQQIAGGSGSWAYSPAWSPDGQRIAFARGRYNDERHWFKHIYLIDAEGTGRTKLSKGDVHDDHPSWSPDGGRIVFERTAGSSRDDDGGFVDTDRHLVVIDVEDRDVVNLAPGGRWEYRPAWSPDGERLAYRGSGGLRIMSPDGTGDRALGVADAWWGGGVAWSPDGSRIAYVQYERDPDTGTSSGTGKIIAFDVDGIAEFVITDLGGRISDLNWSPDGERIAFTHQSQSDDADQRSVSHASAVGAAGTPVPIAADCRPPNPRNHVSVGFPLPDWAPSAVGIVRVAVLFVDFPNARAEHSTHEETARSIPWAEDAFENLSGGRLDVEFEALHQWLTAEHGWEHYADGRQLSADTSQLSVDLAAGKFDFSDIDAVMTVFPSDQFSVANATGLVEADGREVPTFRINIVNRLHAGVGVRAITSNGLTVVHELLHVLGLDDLYGAFGDSPSRRAGSALVSFDFGIMGLGAFVYVDENDPLLSGHAAMDPSESYVDYRVRFYEMLAWSRWQLGWIDSSQSECITADHATVTLDPLGPDADGLLMAAVPVGPKQVIVVEARANDRWRPKFANTGVLVYTVNSRNTVLPVEVAAPDDSELISRLPLLTEGESLVVWGYEFRVTGKTGDRYHLAITRVG